MRCEEFTGWITSYAGGFPALKAWCGIITHALSCGKCSQALHECCFGIIKQEAKDSVLEDIACCLDPETIKNYYHGTLAMRYRWYVPYHGTKCPRCALLLHELGLLI